MMVLGQIARYLRWIGVASLAAALLACGDEGGSKLESQSGASSLMGRTLAEGSFGGQYVFVASTTGNRVHVFDFDTLQPIKTIEVANQPSEIHAHPDGKSVWVLSREAAELTTINVAALEVHSTHATGARPTHSYFAPGYGSFWVGNDGSGDVSVYELRSGHETRVLTGSGHHKMAFASDESGALRFAYVSNISDSTITAIAAGDPPSAVSTISVGSAPHGMDFSSVTRQVYNCSGDAQNSVEVIATEGAQIHQVVGRIPLPSRCGFLHVEEEGRAAFVTLKEANLLVRIDLQTQALSSFATGAGPDKFELDGARAFVSNVEEASVSVIDLQGAGQARSIPVGAAVLPGATGNAHRGLRTFETKLFVPNPAADSVSVIDSASETLITTLEGIANPSGIAIAGVRGGTTYPR